MSQMRPMKDGLNRQAILRIASACVQVLPTFKQKEFEEQALKGLDTLELKERVDHVIEILAMFLPSDYLKTCELMLHIPRIWNYGDKDDSLSGFAAWPIIDYVAHYGIEHPEQSLNLLRRLTPLFSSEFAIRPFLIKYPDLALNAMLKWCQSDDKHVRRLASEGCRPRLPWGIQLKQFVIDPTPIMPILETLRFDNSEYVKKSVANNLNDISKDHPNYLVKTLHEWKLHDQGRTDWIIKHATRTLIKDGHKESYRLQGFTDKPAIDVTNFECSQEVALGEKLEFSFDVVSAKDKQKCVLDYAIYFVRKKGSLNKKVFKLKNLTLDKNKTTSISSAYSFKKISTRQYYAGEHFIIIQINGDEIVKKPFILR